MLQLYEKLLIYLFFLNGQWIDFSRLITRLHINKGLHVEPFIFSLVNMKLATNYATIVFSDGYY